MRKHKMIRVSMFVVAYIMASTQAGASEFRSFRPILSPAMAGGAPGTGSAAALARMRPVSRSIATKAMEKVVAAWNSNQIGSVLSSEFFDRSRLGNAMNTKVPRDARLSVLSIQDVQTLEQHVSDTSGDRQLVSTISVVARTQLTFNDPVGGYQRRQGVNEYIFRVRQRLR